MLRLPGIVMGETLLKIVRGADVVVTFKMLTFDQVNVSHA